MRQGWTGYQSEVRVTGPLAPSAVGFKAALNGAGYGEHPTRNHLWLMAHVSRWLEDQRLTATDFDAERVEAFLADRRAVGYKTLCSRRALLPLLGFLAAEGLGAPVTVMWNST